ncbi:MAG TPA: 5-formyltetrahydrofolate cyclo-ligase [Casimicrobiaceae bacterium]|jgi:5-formyltetrahydrofolate cyclo-ligase|nr:5-formyltetrahydrofolate cyclo-ligase [Casimicrobiaceae bacterium]
MTASPPSVANVGLREAKRSVRERILRARDAMPAHLRIAASTAIAATLSRRPDFIAARVVLLTLPFGSEWDTALMLSAALAGGKTVAVPRVNQERHMLEIHAVCDAAREIAPGYRGIPEPRADCPPVALASIDWVLVPGVAFDAEGRRIGYGGGYYDRLLPLLDRSATRVAGAFELQVVERVPAAPHDTTVDAIVTERRTLGPRSSA